VLYLNVGEWWAANIFFGAVFLVAGAMVVGLGLWVLRGDRLNRVDEQAWDERKDTVTASRTEGEAH
jgi:Tfp pilus assembly protein PilO